MRSFVRLCLLVSLTMVHGQEVRAEPYVFFQVLNDLSQPITFAHYESARGACEATVGNLYTTSPIEFVESAEFFPAGSQCFIRTETNAIKVGAVVSVGASCPGSDEYDFARSTCGLESRDKQAHGVLLAAYLWCCLVGGILVGLKVGE